MKYKEIVIKSWSVHEDEIDENNIQEKIMDIINSLSKSHSRLIEEKRADQEGYNSSTFLGADEKEVYIEKINDTFEYYLAESILKVCKMYNCMDLTRSTIDQRVKNFSKRNSFIQKEGNISEDFLILCNQVCSINMLYNWSNLGTDIEDNFASIISKIEAIAKKEKIDIIFFTEELIKQKNK